MLARADVVEFLDEGRVVASGSHAELLATCPAYSGVVTREETEDREQARS